MAFPVFFDTCTLFSELVNDIILRLAEDHFFAPYWSQHVLDELEHNLAPRINEGHARKRIIAMTTAFPDALIDGYEPLIEKMECDEKDRHVLAATYHSPADTLVTFNIKDFPLEATRKLNIEIRHPDDFLMDVFDLAPGQVSRTCYNGLLSYRRYPQTPIDYAAMLQRCGVSGFASKIYPALSALSYPH